MWSCNRGYCGSVDLYCEWNIHHEEEARPTFCCSPLLLCSLRSPVSIQEGRGANYSHPLLRVHDRRTPAKQLDMLFHGLFIASHLKFYFGNPSWYIEWLGMVDCQLKGTVSRDFLLLVFFGVSFLPAPEYHIRTASNFFKNSRRFATGINNTGLPPVWLVLLIPVANMETMSGCRLLKVDLKAIIYMLTLLPKGVQTK